MQKESKSPRVHYREQALERIARDVITAYDPRLYYGSPAAIPIEDIIEAQGLVLEYQYLRNNGRVLGETIFDDGLTAIYDRENHRYDLLPVKGGTILIDCSLCEEEASTGRLRFTCAHELGHWLLHKKQFSGTGENAALRSGDESDNTLEVQANLLGSKVIGRHCRMGTISPRLYSRLRDNGAPEQLLQRLFPGAVGEEVA